MKVFTVCLLLAGAVALGGTDEQTPKDDSAPMLMFILNEDGKLWSVFVDIVNDGNTSRVETFHADDYDYDPSEGRLYWLDNGRVFSQSCQNGTIQRYLFEYIDYQRLLGLTTKGSIAFDEITRKIYLTEGNHQIDVFDSDLNQYTLYENSTSGLITKIILDSKAGYMFLSVNNNGTREIHRANMDGTSRKIVVADPHGDEIALDRTVKKLVWFNTARAVVEQADYEGKSRSVLVSKLAEPAIFGVMKNQVVWLQAKQVPTGSRNPNNPPPRVCKFEKDVCTEVSVSKSRSAKLYPVKTAGSTPKPVENPCAADNGGCEHGCFLKPSKETGCLCKRGFRALEDDPKRCGNTRPKRQWDMYSQQPTLRPYPQTSELPVNIPIYVFYPGK